MSSNHVSASHFKEVRNVILFQNVPFLEGLKFDLILMKILQTETHL